jgi:hypothetical protein
VLFLGGFVVHVTASRICNVVPRSAVDGQLMDVHDGMIDQWGGIYCWIGMGYQDCTEAAGILPPQDCVLVRYCRAYSTRVPLHRAFTLAAQEYTRSLGAAAFAKTTR